MALPALADPPNGAPRAPWLGEHVSRRPPPDAGGSPVVTTVVTETVHPNPVVVQRSHAAADPASVLVAALVSGAVALAVSRWRSSPRDGEHGPAVVLEDGPVTQAVDFEVGLTRRPGTTRW